MNNELQQISQTARGAVQARDWVRVRACANEILKRRRNSPEGYFLKGLVDSATNRPAEAIKLFSKAISLDAERYDAAIELAGQYLRTHQYANAVSLLQRYESEIGNSPRYLDKAATIYTNVGLPDKALPLYQKANDLQPGVDSLQSGLAACSVFVGRIDAAKDIYRQLLKKFPSHQRNHYELSRLERASDSSHIGQMKDILRSTNLPAERNIYLYYAIGKELEDLEQWNEAFHYYKLAGDAVSSVSPYAVEADVQLIDKIIEVCDDGWLADAAGEAGLGDTGKTPVFIVGLPRTGTTLTERILSCHSMVDTAGESFAMQLTLGKVSGIQRSESVNAAIVEAASKRNIERIGSGYLEAIAYKLGNKPMFIDKLPENFLFLGFIAKAFPHTRLICLNRKPMDACFAMYKQSFFRYAYSLDDLGRYYVAYNRLHQHWQNVLGNRLIEIDYESLVSDQENQTRQLLENVGLEFEEACLNFEQNGAASNTASAVQIREKIHTRSVDRWKCFEEHLRPLANYLENAGISIE